ncbi:MAG: hypothetical protein IT251_04680 [Chitinophagaceae bacterium]|nr:hypothetical protein [Chitinophagaceae bacterium]
MKTTFNLLLNEEDVVQGSTPPVEVASNYTPAGVIKQTGGVTQTPEIDIVGETYTDGGIRYIPTTEEPLTNIKDLPENGDVKYPREPFTLYNTKDNQPVKLTEIKQGVYKIEGYPGTWEPTNGGIIGGPVMYKNDKGDILSLYAKQPTAEGGTTPIKSLTEEGSNLIKNNKKTAIIIIAVIALIVLGSFLSK